MNDYNETSYEEKEIEIDIRNMLTDAVECVRRYWKLMLVICVAAVVIGALWKSVSYQPVYKADTVFTITLKGSSKSSSYEYTYNASTTNYLETNLDGVVASGRYQEMIKRALGLDTLNVTLDLSSVTGTSQFRLTASGNKAEQVLQVLEKAVMYFPEAAADVVGRIRLNIVEEADETASVTNAPEVKTGIVLGAVLGVFVCIAIAMVYVLRRLTSFHKETDLQELLGIRSYGKIVKGKPDTVRSAALRLQKEMDETQKKVLLVEGCAADADIAGFTFELAQMIAKSGKKVLLADCNLAAPQYAELTKNAHRTNSLSRLLEGRETLQSAVLHLKGEDIDLIGNSEPVSDFSRQISMDVFGTFISEAKAQYDYVVFATPGSKSPCGKAAAAEYADGVVYVINRGALNAQRVSENITELTGQKDNLMGGIFFA